MNPSQYAPTPHSFRVNQRSKSPINTQPKQDRNRVSPLKYQLYPQNIPNLPQPQLPSHKTNLAMTTQQPFQQQQQTQKPNTTGNEKQNSRLLIERGTYNGVEQNENKMNAIDRVIKNCNIMNLNSPTKIQCQQGNQNIGNNGNGGGSGNQRRTVTPQTIQNYQTFHQQQQQQQMQQQQGQSQLTVQQNLTPAFQNPYLNVPQHPVQPQSNPATQQYLCFNKDGKKSKYARADNPQQTFCSKCSIILVGMGIKMIDIEPSTSPTPTPTPPPTIPTTSPFQSHKQKQLKHFISQIHNLKHNISKQLTSIDLQKSRISQHILQQKHQLTQRYTQIISLFKQFQSKDLHLLHQFQQQSLRKLHDFQYQFKKSWQKIDLMIKDISPNIEMIKMHISEEQFKGFMGDYYSQVRSIVGRIDTFNLGWKEVRPYVLRGAGMERYIYEGCGMLAREEKNMVYFSFEKKGGEGRDEGGVGGTGGRGEEENVGVGQSIPRIQITTEESWKRENQPFRVLFNEDEHKQQVPSPTFKNI